MVQTSGSLEQSHARNSYTTSQAINNHPDLFNCDNPSVMAQYLQYTPLRPSRILGIQPSTTGEEMLYPESPSRGQYFSNPGQGQATGLGIQCNDQLAGPMDPNSVMAAAGTAGNVASPSLTRQASYGDMPAQYDMLHTYGQPSSLLTGGQEVSEMQARSDFGVVYNPNQRTPSARRGPFKDHEKREKTAHTRRIGSCIRCRMQRIRVSHPDRFSLLRSASSHWNRNSTNVPAV